MSVFVVQFFDEDDALVAEEDFRPENQTAPIDDQMQAAEDWARSMLDEYCASYYDVN